MQLYTYDGTFEGLLTLLFEAYERKVWPTNIEAEQTAQPALFGQTIAVVTDNDKAARVWKGLQQRLSATALKQLYHTYLWEQPGFEMVIYQFIKLAFDSNENIEGNYTAPCVLQVQQAAKQVHREKHRMEAFVRFQQTTDGLYYAHISPDFNVLPLIVSHFTKRYADQRWAVYDSNRQYGIYYDLSTTRFITFDAAPRKGRGELPAHAKTTAEDAYQKLWQVYFDNVNIPERKNPKLHQRHIPKRYWKYLSEKQPRLLQ